MDADAPTAQPSAPRSASGRQPGARDAVWAGRSHVFGRWVAWTVLVANTLVLLVALGSGTRIVDQQVLAADLAAGRVERVEVARGGNEVTWDGPLLTRRTNWEPRDEGANSMHQRVLDEIAATSPKPVEVGEVELTGYASFAGVQLPGWAMLAGLVAWALGLGRLLGCRTPRRGTRWGWLWVVWLCPFVGAGLFALLGDPDGPGPRPRTAVRFNGLVGFALAGLGVLAVRAL